jgi:hypothetical protein
MIPAMVRRLLYVFAGCAAFVLIQFALDRILFVDRDVRWLEPINGAVMLLGLVCLLAVCAIGASRLLRRA